MAKKQYFAIVDSETTVESTVADLGIVICDRAGNIYNRMAVLIKGHFDEKELFYDKTSSELWGVHSLAKRRANYIAMLNDGRRMLASVAAVNNWIAKAVGKYDPILTAYNLPFDREKCGNTGIQLEFRDSFCLWQAAVGNICNSKKFKEFVLQNHGFNSVTEKGNMTFKTNAEIVCGYLNGHFVEEPHTAIEDAEFFELPILKHILKKKDWKSKIKPYNWRDFQVKDHYGVK
jgi:hypothetical protein